MASSDTDKVKKQAMEALTRIYSAAMMAGIKNWVDGSQLMGDAVWQYYHMLTGDDGNKKSADDTRANWISTLENNVRTHVRQLENLHIQYQADYERRALKIIEESFKP